MKEKQLSILFKVTSLNKFTINYFVCLNPIAILYLLIEGKFDDKTVYKPTKRTYKYIVALCNQFTVDYNIKIIYTKSFHETKTFLLKLNETNEKINFIINHIKPKETGRDIQLKFLCSYKGVSATKAIEIESKFEGGNIIKKIMTRDDALDKLICVTEILKMSVYCQSELYLYY